MLEIRELSLQRGPRCCVRQLNLDLAPGDQIGLLGANGCGKSSLLLSLAGLLPIQQGEVRYEGRSLRDLDAAERAGQVGLLLQDPPQPWPMSVREALFTARARHQDWLGRRGPADSQAVAHWLERLSLQPLTDRWLTELSGGEWRRVQLAMLALQAPRIYLADEPTNHLDHHYQHQLLALLRHLARCQGALVALHDVNLALRYCNRLLLLYGDGRWRYLEDPGQLQSGDLAELYQHPFRAFDSAEGRYFLPLPVMT